MLRMMHRCARRLAGGASARGLQTIETHKVKCACSRGSSDGTVRPLLLLDAGRVAVYFSFDTFIVGRNWGILLEVKGATVGGNLKKVSSKILPRSLNSTLQ
eukprot:8798931-Pyramimonas_sp.AAC.1